MSLRTTRAQLGPQLQTMSRRNSNTTTTNNDLVAGAFVTDCAPESPLTAGTNDTMRTVTTSCTTNDYSYEDRVLGTAGSVAMTETFSSRRSTSLQWRRSIRTGHPTQHQILRHHLRSTRATALPEFLPRTFTTLTRRFKASPRRMAALFLLMPPRSERGRVTQGSEQRHKRFLALG